VIPVLAAKDASLRVVFLSDSHVALSAGWTSNAFPSISFSGDVRDRLRQDSDEVLRVKADVALDGDGDRLPRGRQRG
jgi:hypothetical protein